MHPVPQPLWEIESAGTLDHQVATRTQGWCTALHEIAIRLLIEVMEETTDEDEFVFLVPQVVGQCIADTMDDALTHSLLREDLCCVNNGFRQIEYDRA